MAHIVESDHVCYSHLWKYTCSIKPLIQAPVHAHTTTLWIDCVAQSYPGKHIKYNLPVYWKLTWYIIPHHISCSKISPSTTVKTVKSTSQPWCTKYFMQTEWQTLSMAKYLPGMRHVVVRLYCRNWKCPVSIYAPHSLWNTL